MQAIIKLKPLNLRTLILNLLHGTIFLGICASIALHVFEASTGNIAMVYFSGGIIDDRVLYNVMIFLGYPFFHRRLTHYWMIKPQVGSMGLSMRFETYLTWYSFSN